jgi:peptide/nickel transport system substrate-binding protein
VPDLQRRASLRRFSLFAASLLVAAACRPAEPTSQAPDAGSDGPVKGGVLRVATFADPPKVLHPYPEPQQNTTPRTDAATLMFANLIDLDYTRLEWVADPRRSLARDLPDVSDDGLTFTFTLRDDVRWSDGQPITSADFQFAWDNASQKANNFVGLADLERIARYETPTPLTIRVTLKQPQARFLALTVANTIIPIPRQVWFGKPWSDPTGNPEILQPTVVSGPFMPQEFTPAHQRYVRNPAWYGQPSQLDGIDFINNATPQTAFQMLTTRQVEWAENLSPSQVVTARQTPGINVLEWSGAVGSYRLLIFNTQRPALADRRVREALVRMIDRADLVQFEDDLAVPQYGVYTDGSLWRSDDVERYDPDPAVARQLLQDAGYMVRNGVLQDGGGQPLKLDIIWPTSSQPRGRMATYLQQQWETLGVEVTVTGLEFNAFTDKYQRLRDFDIAMGSYNATADPDSFKAQVTTGGTQNASGYSNPRVDELVQLGAAEQDEAKRHQLYDDMQRLIVKDLPQYFMLTVKNFTALDNRVGGVRPSRGVDILRQNNLQVLDWYLRP